MSPLRWVAPPGLDLSWQEEAACARIDPDLWYPDTAAGNATPKRVCRACPVQGACLDYALAADERWGIWGGTSERERRRIKKRTNAAQEAS